LLESEGRLQAIIDNSPALIFLKDLAGRYLLFNREFGRVFEISGSDAIGKTDHELFPADQAAAFRANDLQVLTTGTAMVFDEVAVHADGAHTSIVTKFPLTDADGAVFAVGGIATDITERKRLESDVLQISEREQRRFAQDLHDGLGQYLVGTLCLGEVLHANLASQKSPEAAAAGKITALLKSTLAQTRGLVRGLHPVPSEPAGLMSALEDLAANVADMFKVVCRFECPQPVHLHDHEVATHLYRIVQEALTNALKHGRARHVRIHLSARPHRGVRVGVFDDGGGLQPDGAKRRGFGLRIMAYRAGLIGANLVVANNRDRGARVVCTLAHPAKPNRPKASTRRMRSGGRGPGKNRRATTSSRA